MSMIRNLGIAIAALLIPAVAELVSPETDMGFAVLLYQPFDFAYALLVGVIFVVSNQVKPDTVGRLGGLIVGLACWLAWFAISFLAIGQLHVFLGYPL